MDEKDVDQTGEDQVDNSKRNIVAALLGSLGVVALSSCTNQVGSSEAEKETIGRVLQAASGTKVRWVSWIGTQPGGQNNQNIRDLPGDTHGEVMIAEGFWQDGDGGGGVFFWDIDTNEHDNGGTLIVPFSNAGDDLTPAQAGQLGCWKRIYSGPLNVRWFGAKGNGTDNDSPSIQRALAAVQNGGEVHFPTGSYRLTSGLRIPGSGITLRGAGMWRSEIRYDGATDSVIRANTLSSHYAYVHVFDLAVCGKNAGDVLLDYSSVSVSTISRCRLWGGDSFVTRRCEGIRLSSASAHCYANTVEHCEIQYCASGVRVTAGANENRVVGGQINSNTAGIKVDGGLSDNLRILYVRIEDNVDGVHISDFANFTIAFCRFEKSDHGSYGLRIAGGSPVHHPILLIANTYASYGAGYDLDLTGLSGRIEVIGESPDQYQGTTGRGQKYLGLAELGIGAPQSNGDSTLSVQSGSADANLVLAPKGSGGVVAGGFTQTNILRLIDGVSPPAAAGGAAQIYVDSADGDLKVKFGDGTVKTIAFDT